ncbi:hypothetical protein VB773_13665 [Haloarculaceae archaeon H-GB2-1]|nr:hypothetical protein [Haloarculaceae archaeon H-GB1-1]MEA5387010.1 hypothetical protein [Haloarculaceae archaeon H-GB11]MEA5408512.1 hypothetical protein [Haloarculaceae archaeon H-GB2-1]
MVFTEAVLKAGLHLDPPENRRVPTVVLASTLAFLAAVHLFFLGWNLGYTVSTDLLLGGIAVWTVAIVATRSPSRTTSAPSDSER